MTVKIVRGITLQPQSLLLVKSLVNFLIHYRLEVKITNAKVMKISNYTKLWSMNVNLRSEISREAL